MPETVTTLPIPPAGSWWEITGEPRGPWVWSSGIAWQYDSAGSAIGAEHYAVASAPGATAVWRHAAAVGEEAQQ